MKEYIFNISTVNAFLPPGIDEVITPYPPTPFQSMIFYGNDAVSMNRAGDDHFSKQPLSVLIGPQFSRVNVKVHQRLRAIRVDFLPGAIYRMLGVPMNELFDEGFDAKDLFGNEIRTLTEQLIQVDLDAGKQLVENFLLNKISASSQLLPIDQAIRTMMGMDGLLPIETAASLSCLSLKQFERKCQQRLGMNPKMYARILRFSKAYRLHESSPGLNWISIAHESGYYDQMHMIRDFKIFAGVNPSVLEQQLLATPLRMQKDLHY